jgi:N6-adenosine-specific RNA methylase IME4
MNAPTIINSETGEILSDVAWRGVSLHIPEATTFEEWSRLGKTLQQMERSVMWWIGDWLRFGERKYGETYTQAVEATGYSLDACKNAKWVAEAYAEPSTRVDGLTWTHHREVAALPPADRAAVLARAASEGLSTRETKALAKREKNRVGAKYDTCTTDDLAALIARGDKFGTIYADPPWVYDNQSTRAATGNHYGGLTVDELCALPVKDLAAKDAHLHLWTTNAFLFDCARIFDAWGFEFRSSFVWVKPQMGIGNYWRNSHEFLLTAIRGDAKRFNDRSLMSWLECERSRHSEKPYIVRDYIRRASCGPYLEMFARTPADGWTCWGNEIERGLLFPHAEQVA